MRTSKAAKPEGKNPHRGSSFDEFLAEEGILEQAEAVALKRSIALAITDLMREQKVQKSTMAKRMQTSRASLDRLLDPENSSVTLATLGKAAQVLGQELRIELVPA